jgi:hypothetical protein
LASIGRSPVGHVDQVSGGAGKINLSGWAFDPDLPRTSLTMHIYVGDPSGSHSLYSITADQTRNDVAAAYPGTGSTHGYGAQLTTSRRGSVPVYIYAIDIGGTPSANSFLGSGTAYVY